MSERYTHGHHESVLASHAWRTVENSAAYLLPHLRPGASVVDVGCGPGTITVDVAERVAPGRVVGIDAAADVLNGARTLAVERGLTNVEFTVGDAYALGLPDGSVDVVHAHQVLQHLARPAEALREWRRVCAPGGVVAARDVDYAGIIWYPQLPELERWLALYHDVARADGGEPDAGRRMLAWAHEAGFTDVEASASVWCFATSELRAWWGGAWSRRILESAFAGNALQRGLATQDELHAISAAWQTWAAHPDGWVSLPHGEMLARP